MSVTYAAVHSDVATYTHFAETPSDGVVHVGILDPPWLCEEWPVNLSGPPRFLDPKL